MPIVFDSLLFLPRLLHFALVDGMLVQTDAKRLERCQRLFRLLLVALPRSALVEGEPL